MFGFAEIANSIGGAHGSWKAAKGWKGAQDDYNKLKGQLKDIYGDMDPFGAEKRRGAGNLFNQALYDPSAIETTGQYQFVMDEAMRATEREHAAGGFGVGSGSSGNVAAALQDRAAGLASKEYSSIMDRLERVSGASAEIGLNSGLGYMGSLSDAVAGGAEARIGKYNSYANMTQQAHTAGGQIGDMIAGFGFSDESLKKNITQVGKDGDFNVYEWEWNEDAEQTFGLTGKATGFIAQEVRKVMPEAVTTINGYLAIDYGYLEEVA